MEDKSIPFSREDLTIMGVQFDTLEQFNNVMSAVASNYYEGWRPEMTDIVRLRDLSREAMKNDRF